MRRNLKQYLLAILSVIILTACEDLDKHSPRTANNTASLASYPEADWQYPIRLGDTRAHVDTLLGGGEQMTPELTEYAASGVSIWFNHERVAKLNFSTLPWPVNTEGNAWIPSDRAVAWGLSVSDDEAKFRRILGKPARTSEQGAWLECTWRKDSHIVTGYFLEGYLLKDHFVLHPSEAQRQDPNAHPSGRLFWFEVYRGL
jgi:hypothetical protein